MPSVVRVAIVGAGPAGIYSAEALTKGAVESGRQIEVDIIDRVPSPFGLVRYGVAPDHLSIRSVRDTLDRVLAEPNVRFLGNIEVTGDASVGVESARLGRLGRVSIERLRANYDAIIFCYGAATDRNLGIPGENCVGSLSATQFVNWYTGHPDTAPDAWNSMLGSARSIAVLGVGNVAVDVVRVLAKDRTELEHTDMPEHVLGALGESVVTDIHLIGRRGPAEASWTTKELRELGELANAQVVVDPSVLNLGESSRRLVESSKVVARNVEVIRQWVQQPPRQTKKRIHLHFFRRPTQVIVVDGAVAGIELEETALSQDGQVSGLEQVHVIPVDAVIRSVGYRGLPIPGLPFDDSRGVIPHVDGRMMEDGAPVPGMYVAGWIKRGPSGIIGTNKKDAVNTVASVLADLESGTLPARTSSQDVAELTGSAVVSHEGWQRIDAAERALGTTRSRERTTIHDRVDSISIATQAL